jgi:hypothetical protein
MAPPRSPLLPPLVAVLAAVALVAAPVGAAGAAGTATDPRDTPLVVPLTNTTNQAAPDDVVRRGYGQADVDVAGAVAVDAARLGGRHDTLALAERLDGAEDQQARLAAVRATLDRVETRLDSLDRRQGELYAAYSDGSLSTATFLRRLAELEAAATQQRELVGEVSRQADAAGVSLPVATQTRIARLRADLVVLPNPVADGLVDGVAGTGTPSTLYLEAAADGLVLATVADGTYHRTATVRADRQPGSPDRFAGETRPRITVAYDRAAELYPWLFDNAIGNPSIRGFGDTSVYLIEGAHPQGNVRTYIDGATRNVFHELQSKDPDTVPVTATVENTSGGLELAAGTTHPTGPMTVSLVRPATDTPVDATVRIDGQPVGTTGPDGRLTTVQPAGPFRMNATVDGATVTLAGP